MSISDEIMWDYYRLLLLKTSSEIDCLKKAAPHGLQKQLSQELTSLFHGQEQGLKELESFTQVFSMGENPDEMTEFSLSSLNLNPPSILNFLSATNLFESKGQIRRLITQGAVKLEGEKVLSPDLDLKNFCEGPLILRAGKKIFLRVTP